MKKRLLFISLFALSILINTLPLLIFKNALVFTAQSAVSVVIMVLVSINGIISYFLRHKGNFLSFGKPRGNALSDDKDYTFTKEYNKEFSWQFTVYCLTIPFYIPCIFFVSKWEHLLWTLCILIIPQLIYVAYGILNTFKDVKDYRLEHQKQAKELQEQIKNEEMGRFK